MIRLQKYMSDCGICSRRKAEEHILNGDVKVNGKVVSELGTKISEGRDKVLFKGELVKIKDEKTYMMLNKPKNCITTAKEQFDRKMVFDYINTNTRVVPVGRLDYDTTGLLLFTDDGELTFKLTHPKSNIKKIYIAKVIGTPTESKMFKFRNGLVIDNYKTAPATIKIIEKGTKICTLEICIKEGKNRQIRKMCEAIGHKVVSLERVAIGDIKLDKLKIGESRYLTKSEIKYLKKL